MAQKRFCDRCGIQIIAGYAVVKLSQTSHCPSADHYSPDVNDICDACVKSFKDWLARPAKAAR